MQQQKTKKSKHASTSGRSTFASWAEWQIEAEITGCWNGMHLHVSTKLTAEVEKEVSGKQGLSWTWETWTFQK